MTSGMPEEKLREVREAFRKFDTDRSGSIEPGELRALLQTLGQNPTAEDILKLMEEMDLNRNGKIELHEFEAFMAKMYKEPPAIREELLEAFRVIDKDKDGYISPEELLRVMVNIGEKLTLEEAQQMIKEADKDGDGRVNYEEYVNVMYPS